MSATTERTARLTARMISGEEYKTAALREKRFNEQ